jgi:transmembrane protein 8A/B
MGLFCHGDAPIETTARTAIIDSVKTFIRHNAQMLKAFKAPCSCATDLNLSHYRDCLESQSCLNQMNETETLKIKECLMDAKCTGAEHSQLSRAFDIHHKRATEQSVNGRNLLSSACIDGNCNTSIAFTLASNPCVTGRCGRNGRCYHYMSGGFVFSTCLCLKFYRGWDCTEDSQVPSSISILAASLLLTLSNLLFIPSIYFAIRRKYYTEAIIYFFAMFFSTFYHACDSGDEEFTFCLVKISVLQFCDFYCGLLAIWVTLIAMANVRPVFVSLLHMLGAILLAFGTELNKQSLWVFLAPALSGICIVSISWTMKCRKHNKVYPSKKYFAIYLPLGTVLVGIGLVSALNFITKMCHPSPKKNNLTRRSEANKLIFLFFSFFPIFSLASRQHCFSHPLAIGSLSLSLNETYV